MPEAWPKLFRAIIRWAVMEFDTLALPFALHYLAPRTRTGGSIVYPLDRCSVPRCYGVHTTMYVLANDPRPAQETKGRRGGVAPNQVNQRR